MEASEVNALADQLAERMEERKRERRWHNQAKKVVAEHFSKRDAWVAFLTMILGAAIATGAGYYWFYSPVVEELRIYNALTKKGE